MMRIPHIKIQQHFAQLGLNIKPADLKIEKENSMVNVQQEPAKIDVKYRKPDIQVDWQPVWDDIGLKAPADVSRDIRHKANRKTLEIIGQITQDGDRLGNIASGERNTIAKLLKEKFFRDQRVETTIAAIPTKGPAYQVTTYHPEISAQPGKVTVNPNDIEPIIDYRIGDVDVYWLQKPQVNISI